MTRRPHAFVVVVDLPCKRCGKVRPRRLFVDSEAERARANRSAGCLSCAPQYRRESEHRPRPAVADDADDIAVELLCAGLLKARKASAADRLVAVGIMTRRGRTAEYIAEKTGMTVRSVVRWRARIRDSENARAA